ncbi:hypothetical protein ColLi_13751 [Colletotrichum liriopes]|uniref:NAD-specific glutamate dehydrogenase n=1 Tax=Colletotrichum liriopes TaxID=708192 RepID=A0AA37M0Z9_9PEZI|nr:hypothetical protein ColLi_13751 [Colletotrichum liriopes]
MLANASSFLSPDMITIQFGVLRRQHADAVGALLQHVTGNRGAGLLLVADELVHERNVVVLRHASVLGRVRAAVRGDDLDELIDDLVGDEGVAEVHLSDVGLAVGYLAEGLEDLLGRVLVLGDVDHEADELLKGDVVTALGGVHKVVVHFVFGEDEAQRGEGGAELKLLERVGVVAVKVAEDGLELLELDRGEVGHVARDHLVVEEGELFLHRRLDETVLVDEFVVRVRCKVVFFDVGLLALCVHSGDGLEVLVQRRQVITELADVV